MADSKTLEPKSLAQKDVEAIDKYNRILKQTLEREEKLKTKWIWRGANLPPFNIEPLPYERQRLAGAGMTPEDRALRKQWLHDQILSPNEPRHIPELRPRNVFRRMWALPWDAMESALKPVVGTYTSRVARVTVPKMLTGLLVTWGIWYNLKYCPATWESIHGWNMYGTKPRTYPGDADWPRGKIKSDHEFCDKGFTNRKAVSDLKTSAVER